jgi:MoxR-like ATPase
MATAASEVPTRKKKATKAVIEVVSNDVDSNVFVVPTEDPNFVVSDGHRSFFRSIEFLSRRGKRPKVLLRGPQGAGKTGLAEFFGAVTGRPFHVLDAQTIREQKDVIGYKDVDYTAAGAMEIIFRLSGFARAVETPRALILIDEITRAQPQLMNLLLPLLDHRGRVYVDELDRCIEVAEGVVFMATANVGLQFTGTWQMDAALADRLAYQLDVGYLPAQVEAEVLVNKTGIEEPIAKRLAEIAEITRQRVIDENDPLSHEISTRQLLATADLIVEGMAPNDALMFTVVPTYSTEGGTESHRANVLQIIQGKLGDDDFAF